ncbi:hypothetical protein ACUN29_02685 [Streptomyces sp. WC2508]|uniref:hypothetical protein n=1 Tax=Streptomyces sp. WC2508 TaxID=3461405 RepID=UPI0040441D26
MASAAADPGLGTEQIGVGLAAVVSVRLDRPLFLAAVVSVRLDRPLFLGATNGVLGSAAVGASVAGAAREHLGTWLEEHPEQAAAVIGRIVRGARRNRAADRAHDSRSLPATQPSEVRSVFVRARHNRFHGDSRERPPSHNGPVALARGFLTGGVVGASLAALVLGTVIESVPVFVAGLGLPVVYALLFFLARMPRRAREAAVVPCTALAKIETWSSPPPKSGRPASSCAPCRTSASPPSSRTPAPPSASTPRSPGNSPPTASPGPSPSIRITVTGPDSTASPEGDGAGKVLRRSPAP